MTYAITIWQPWCSAIVSGPKRVENRGWKPPLLAIGKRILLHAGKHFDLSGSERCARLGFDRAKADLPRGAIIGSALLVGWQDDEHDHLIQASRLVVRDYRRDPWWVGPIGWALDDVRKLHQPIPCVGRQGLWLVSQDILQQAVDQGVL